MEKEVNSNYPERILQLEKLLDNKTRQLQEVTQELDDITFAISHDLKAPIRAIAGFSAILKEEQSSKLDDEGKRVIEVIENNALKLTGMLNDIISYSAISKKNLQWQPVNMNALAAEAIDVIMTAEEKTAFAIITDDLENCNADGKMMKQLWLNLVNIAALYAEKNICFKINIGCTADDSTVTYHIKACPAGQQKNEPGAGINMEANIMIHEQLESAGTGAAFIKRVLFKHGGNFWIQSKPLGGCSFFFRLPKNQPENL